MANTVESTEVKTLESKVYKTYYEKNPEGDARNSLWPAVLKAKKEKDPLKALNDLLSEVEEDKF